MQLYYNQQKPGARDLSATGGCGQGCSFYSHSVNSFLVYHIHSTVASNKPPVLYYYYCGKYMCRQSNIRLWRTQSKSYLHQGHNIDSPKGRRGHAPCIGLLYTANFQTWKMEAGCTIFSHPHTIYITAYVGRRSNVKHSIFIPCLNSAHLRSRMPSSPFWRVYTCICPCLHLAS